MNNLHKYIGLIVPVLIVAAFLAALSAVNWSPIALFLTPDQRGRLLMGRNDYKAAAKHFQDPMQRGAALYKDGEFKAAAAAFGRNNSVEALYNRANALLMQGMYDAAINAYETVLTTKQGWQEAEENLSLARARKEKMAPPEDDAGGTGGMLAADEIVFDDRANNNPSAAEQEFTAEGDQISDREMRAIWLRRVQTEPADFLRAKFSYQSAMNQTTENER